MIDLGHFRNRAKRFVRWHRDGYYPVAATIRRFLPKFRKLSDPRIMSSRFKLADAQELVARSVGFESWSALKKDDSHMPQVTSSEQSSARLLAAEPQVFVTDIERAIRYFGDHLGRLSLNDQFRDLQLGGGQSGKLCRKMSAQR